MNQSDGHLQVILVDLDDTVYPHRSGLMLEVGRRIHLYMTERMQLPPDQAQRLRRLYFEKYGTTLRGLQIHEQVDAEDYLRFVHDIPVEKYIQPAPRLDEALASLPQQKVIFTNATAEHAENVLGVLGIRWHFSRIIDLRALGYINKPDPEAYLRTLVLLQTPADACLLAEDSLRNLRPASALGMATVLVASDGQELGHGEVDGVIEDLCELPTVVAHVETRKSRN